MKLSEIAILVEDKIGSNSISLGDYVTTDSLLPNKEGKTIIMVTHEPEIAAFAKRQIVIRDGVISSDSKKGEA